METLLIILALGAVVVGVIVWISRKKAARPFEQRLEQDTAWNDAVRPNAQPPVDPIPTERAATSSDDAEGVNRP